MRTPSLSARSQLTRGAWGVLLFALVLVMLSMAQVVYRSTLPTDGWVVLSTESLASPGWAYLANMVGAPSGLRRDDVVIAVDGRSLPGQAGTAPVPPPPGWGVRPTAELSIMRQNRQLKLPVPIVRWSLPALWRVQLCVLEQLVGLLGGLILGGLALFTFRQRPSVPAARALLVLSAAFLSISISHLVPDGLSTQFNRLAFFSSVFFGYLLFPVLLAPSLLAFMVLFPRPKRIIERYPALGLAPFALGLLVGLVLVSGHAPVIGWLATQAMVVAALSSLLHSSFTQRDVVSRAQLLWAGSGLAIGMALMLLVLPIASGMVADPLLAQLLGAGFQIGFTLIGVCLAIAVLRYRLFDIELVVNRALVYGTLTVCVIGLYVLVVGYLGMLFRVEDNLPLSLVATGVVAVAFAPLRSLVQRGANRLMYGERDEPYGVLSRLGRQLSTAVEPSSMLALTVETVARALKLPFVAIALHQAGSLQTVAAYGSARPDVNRVPLMYAGEPVGELIVAPRAAHEGFTPADQRLLHDLARQIGVAAHAVLLTANLEQARLRLVSERGEARRRLGSDLHDVVGHQLAGLTRQAERTMRALPDDPALAQQLLADSTRQLVALSSQVRGLAHQLFPPELEVLGLAGALSERAQSFAEVHVAIDAPDQVPTVPAETEAAVYLIALEAMTNVAKHAQARRCQVRLRWLSQSGIIPGAVLSLDVIDDGRGLPADATGGLGLLSMQARAADVGGTCWIEPAAGGGTAVHVRIPCPASSE